MQNLQKKVSFYTLGCKLNFAETSTISRKFIDEGYQCVDISENTNVVVINTCSVTQLADKKCRQVISKVSRTSPNAIVVIIGCYSQLKPDEIVQMKGVDLVLGTKDKFNIMNYINILQNNQNQQPIVHSCEIENVSEFNPSYSLFDRTRSFLKIQDGCNYHCSYCTIPLARGKSRNGTIENTLAETCKIVGEGIKEVVITGVNIGDFGQSTNESFIDLIKEMDKIEGVERYRISSIEPNLLTNEIIEFVSESKRFVPHFHIPLQSGCNRILNLMSRRYNRELFFDRIETIKSIMPHACIGADVIVGFPGETDDDFQDTLQFIEDSNISYLHVFTYSERKNTRSLLLPDKVPVQIKSDRSKKLIDLSKIKRSIFYTSQIGKYEKVLFESEHKGKMFGFTSNYVKIEIIQDKSLINKILNIKMTELLPSGNMNCVLVNE